jgi:ATP-dependent DNA helicase RecG
VQAGQGVNAPGIPEVQPLVFEGLPGNALVHRDYPVSAASAFSSSTTALK